MSRRTNILICAALALGIGLALSAAGPPGPKTDRDRAELHGPVKMVSVRWQANHRDAYGEVEDRELGTTTYDPAGNLLVDRTLTADFVKEKKPERHGANETIFHAVVGDSLEHYRFDTAGNLIELQEWYRDDYDYRDAGNVPDDHLLLTVRPFS